METFIFQVLISEAGGHKMDKHSKEERKRPSSSSQEKDMTSSSESHVEMDSRLLTALLTVSINYSAPLIFCNFFEDAFILF